MKLFLIIFLISIQSFAAISNSDEEFDYIIYLIKSKKFKLATSFIAKSNYNTNTKIALEEYIKVLYNAGQNTVLLTDIKDIEPNSKLEFIKTLTYGYKELYSNPYTIIPFESFNKALIIAEENKNTTMKNEALRAILNVYDFEIAVSDKSYNDYINHYKNLIQDSIDAIYYHQHNLNFKWQTLNNFKIDTNLIRDYTYTINSTSDISFFKADYLSNKGVILEVMELYDEALKNYKLSNYLLDNNEYSKYIKFRNYVRSFSVNLKQDNIALAKKNLDSAILYRNNADTLRSQYYINAYSSQYAEKKKDYKNAYELFNKLRQNEIQLDYKKNSLAISKLNVQFQTEKKEKELLEEQSKRLKNQNIALLLGVFLIISTFITFLIYRNTKRKQRIAEQEKALQIQKTTTILKEQEINTINAMIEGQEKERLHIARDLHDNLGGTLAAVKMHIGNLQNSLDTSHNPQELLDKANLLISDAYQKVRSIAHERNSGVMANQGLLPAIEKLVHKVSTSNGLSVEIQHFGLEERLSNHLEITIFRIIQELVTNVIKHAQATELQISLTQHEKELNIVVEDNGKGFIVGKLEEKEGMGLGSIERRIEHLEGSILVDSTPKKGTNIIIDIPIK